MRGHEKIISMRKVGKRPSIVFLNDFPCQTDWFEFGEHATVDVSGEQPEWLDLRYLIGLRVSITSKSEKRAKRLMEACKRAGCVTVAAGCAELRNGRWTNVWSDVWNNETETV